MAKKLLYRKLVIRNSNGDRLDLATDSNYLWAYEPQNFGVSYDYETAEDFMGFFETVSKKRAIQELRFTLQCQNRSAYRAFADTFINNDYPLQLERYTIDDDLDIAPYADVELVSTTHGDVDVTTGLFPVELVFNQMTPWRFKKFLLEVNASGGAMIPMDLTESDGETMGWELQENKNKEYTIKNPTNKFVPTKLLFEGIYSNPGWELSNTSFDYKEYYKSGTFETSMINSTDKLVVNAIPSNYIQLNDEDAETIQDELKFNYLFIPPGQSTLTILGSSGVGSYQLEAEILKDDS